MYNIIVQQLWSWFYSDLHHTFAWIKNNLHYHVCFYIDFLFSHWKHVFRKGLFNILFRLWFFAEHLNPKFLLVLFVAHLLLELPGLLLQFASFMGQEKRVLTLGFSLPLVLLPLTVNEFLNIYLHFISLW